MLREYLDEILDGEKTLIYYSEYIQMLDCDTLDNRIELFKTIYKILLKENKVNPIDKKEAKIYRDSNIKNYCMKPIKYEQIKF